MPLGWTYAPVLAYQVGAMEVLPDSVLSAELGPGERLVWSGKPRGGIRLRAQDAFLIPFSLLWCGFAIFWEVRVSMNSGPLFGPGLFFRLWGIPFVIVGLYMVLGRFFVDALIRAGTYYGVTTERVLIVTTRFGRRLRSISLRALGDISLSERSDESGTIAFGFGQPIPQPFGSREPIQPASVRNDREREKRLPADRGHSEETACRVTRPDR
jgi:hypothetical protein